MNSKLDRKKAMKKFMDGYGADRFACELNYWVESRHSVC